MKLYVFFNSPSCIPSCIWTATALSPFSAQVHWTLSRRPLNTWCWLWHAAPFCSFHKQVGMGQGCTVWPLTISTEYVRSHSCVCIYQLHAVSDVSVCFRIFICMWNSNLLRQFPGARDWKGVYLKRAELNVAGVGRTWKVTVTRSYAPTCVAEMDCKAGGRSLCSCWDTLTRPEAEYCCRISTFLS